MDRAFALRSQRLSGASSVAGDPVRLFGVNLVRLHHMDSQPDSTPSNAGSLLTTGPYPTLNTVAVARLRAFLTALRAEGIYATLNLHVGCQFRPSVDGVPALPGGVAFRTQSKPLHILYRRFPVTPYSETAVNKWTSTMYCKINDLGV
jgi:hypothetical protein